MLNNVVEMNENTLRVFNLYSTMNEWCDLMIAVNPKDYSKAMKLGQQYLFDWHDEDTDEPIGNYIKRRYKEAEIEADVYAIIDNVKGR